jgi:hypothetical protein
LKPAERAIAPIAIGEAKLRAPRAAWQRDHDVR